MTSSFDLSWHIKGKLHSEHLGTQGTQHYWKITRGISSLALFTSILSDFKNLISIWGTWIFTPGILMGRSRNCPDLSSTIWRKIRDIRFVESYIYPYCTLQASNVWVKAVPWARCQNLQKCDLTCPREKGHISLTESHKGLKFSVCLKKSEKSSYKKISSLSQTVRGLAKKNHLDGGSNPPRCGLGLKVTCWLPYWPYNSVVVVAYRTTSLLSLRPRTGKSSFSGSDQIRPWASGSPLPPMLNVSVRSRGAGVWLWRRQQVSTFYQPFSELDLRIYIHWKNLLPKPGLRSRSRSRSRSRPESVVLTGVGVGVGVGKFSSTPTPARSRSRLQHFSIMSFQVKMRT